VLTLTAMQLALVCAGAAVGGAIFGVIGFAYGVLISLFIHHAFAAPDVVFIVVGGAFILNLFYLPRFWREIRWRGDVVGQTEQQDAAPFAVCVTQLTAS